MRSWRPRTRQLLDNARPGLKRTEVRHVYAAPTGWWAALTNGGWMKYDDAAHKWVRAGLYVPDTTSAPAVKTTKGKKGVTPKAAAPKNAAPQLTAFLVNAWRSAGMPGTQRRPRRALSKDHGATWKPAQQGSAGRASRRQSVEVAAPAVAAYQASLPNAMPFTRKAGQLRGSILRCRCLRSHALLALGRFYGRAEVVSGTYSPHAPTCELRRHTSSIRRWSMPPTNR